MSELVQGVHGPAGDEHHLAGLIGLAPLDEQSTRAVVPSFDGGPNESGASAATPVPRDAGAAITGNRAEMGRSAEIPEPTLGATPHGKPFAPPDRGCRWAENGPPVGLVGGPPGGCPDGAGKSRLRVPLLARNCGSHNARSGPLWSRKMAKERVTSFIPGDVLRVLLRCTNCEGEIAYSMKRSMPNVSEECPLCPQDWSQSVRYEDHKARVELLYRALELLSVADDGVSMTQLAMTNLTGRFGPCGWSSSAVWAAGYMMFKRSLSPNPPMDGARTAEGG